jgi:hypothetical protein
VVIPRGRVESLGRLGEAPAATGEPG